MLKEQNRTFCLNAHCDVVMMKQFDNILLRYSLNVYLIPSENHWHHYLVSKMTGYSHV